MEEYKKKGLVGIICFCHWAFQSYCSKELNVDLRESPLYDFVRIDDIEKLRGREFDIIIDIAFHPEYGDHCQNNDWKYRDIKHQIETHSRIKNGGKIINSIPNKS